MPRGQAKSAKVDWKRRRWTTDCRETRRRVLSKGAALTASDVVAAFWRSGDGSKRYRRVSRSPAGQIYRPLSVVITWTVIAKMTVPNRYDTIACCNTEFLIGRLFTTVSVTP